MKIYNKKGLFAGIFLILLACCGIFLDFRSPDSNTLVQIRDSIISIFLLLMGLNSFWRAFSKKASKEDIIEKYDERNRLIEYKSQSRMLDIVYAILFVIMVCGIIGFKLTANIVWGCLFVIPGFLLGLFLIIQIFVKFYYEKYE